MRNTDDHGLVDSEGNPVSIGDPRRLIETARARYSEPGRFEDFLLFMGSLCKMRGWFWWAVVYLEELHGLVLEPDLKARCLLLLGQTWERLDHLDRALATYSEASELASGDAGIWYFLHNNRGYCLNHFGRHREALHFCDAAIAIDASRHNAYKNRGVALAGLGRCREAARSLLEAARIYPRDPRALAIFEGLLRANPALLDQDPALLLLLAEAREAAPRT